MEKSKFCWENDGFSFVPEVEVTLSIWLKPNGVFGGNFHVAGGWIIGTVFLLVSDSTLLLNYIILSLCQY